MLQLGDQVTIAVAKENREWGYNPAPDGTKGEVVGFSHIDYGRTNGHTPPGIYLNRFWPKVRLETGNILCLSSCHVKALDPQSYLDNDKDNWVSDLPETPFWEGDVVNIHYPNYDKPPYYITSISYLKLSETTDAGSPWPAYTCSSRFLGAGWHATFKETELELLERGKVWKFYHNEPIEFADLNEEANFANCMGQTESLKNPESNNYAWTLEEVLKAIRDGYAHGFSAGNSMFSGGIFHTVLRFKDEDLGQRIRAKVLSEFANRIG